MAEQVVFHPDILCIPEGGEKPYLIAYKCSCGSAWFPKLPFCPNCWSEKLEPMPLSKTGQGSYFGYSTGQCGMQPSGQRAYSQV